MKDVGIIDTGLTISFFQVLRTIRRWFLPLFGVATVMSAIVYQILAPLPPLFTATTVLWFDERESSLLASDSAWASLSDPNTVSYVNEVAPIVKEAEIMGSLPIYQRVINELALEQQPAVLNSGKRLLRSTIKGRLASILPFSSPDDPDESAVQTGTPEATDDADNTGYLLELAKMLGAIITVQTNELTSVISVEVSSPNPMFAAAIANAVPQAYVDEHNERITFASRSVVKLLSQRVAQIRKRLEAETPEEISGSLALHQLTREAEVELFQSLLNRLNEVQQLQDIQSSPVQVLTPAVVPSEPAGASAFDYAVLTFIGLMLSGMAVIAGVELASNRIRFPKQIENMNLQILAAAPSLDARGWMPEWISRRLGKIAKPPAPDVALFNQAIRRLMTVTRPKRQDQSVSLLLTSASDGEGTSTIAYALALSASRSGLKTILIEADMRPGVEHEGGPRGLVSLLRGQCEIDDVLVESKEDTGVSLWILPASETVDYSAELLASQPMHNLMHELPTVFDVVIIDSAPVLYSADAEVLATLTDGVILVAGFGTRQKRLESAVELLDRDCDNLLGAFVNNAPPQFFSDLYGKADSGSGWLRRKPRTRSRSIHDAVSTQLAQTGNVTSIERHTQAKGRPGVS
ncbi:hypothetical protein [uncultured Tateyamaria sp.]|uniref:polysaccharide biosynthesis tyrosine autokinase n=1 Tax=uncultured Tateyamaria sp. TaxID=455651 RepID=UPI002621E1C5|nr:hypothetical protein [uncultured Tateyamaria sp.]